MEPVKIERWADIRELARMSIGTDQGTWWADPEFGSKLWKLRQEGKVNNRTAGVVQQLILECLQWLKDDKIVSDITCTAEQSGKVEISYVVTMVRPSGESEMIKDTWNAV